MNPQEITQAQALISDICSSNRDWIPALAGIFGALVGAIASIIPNSLMDSQRIKNESRLVEASLIAEMTALVEIAEERGYLSNLKQIINLLEEHPPESKISFWANVPPHYSRIYQENAHRIGIVDKKMATDIIRFHQLVDAVVQDIIPGGVMSSGATIDTFRQNYQILCRAFDIQRKYADYI